MKEPIRITADKEEIARLKSELEFCRASHIKVEGNLQNVALELSRQVRLVENMRQEAVQVTEWMQTAKVFFDKIMLEKAS